MPPHWRHVIWWSIGTPPRPSKTLVARGDYEKAYENFCYYGIDPRVDAFECYSLRRQFTQVWRLWTNEPPGDVLIPCAECGLLLTKAWWQHRAVPRGCLRKVSEAGRARSDQVAGRPRKRSISTVGMVQDRPGSLPCRCPGGIDHRPSGRDGLPGSSWGFLPQRWGGTGHCSTNSHVICPEDNLNRRAITPSGAGQLRGDG